MLGDDAPEDFEDGRAAFGASPDEQDARVRAGLEPANVAEPEIQGDEEAALGYDPLPHHRVAFSGEPLVVGAIGNVAAVAEEAGMNPAEVLVQLDEELAHRRGTSSSSRARTAAYASAACTS